MENLYLKEQIRYATPTFYSYKILQHILAEQNLLTIVLQQKVGEHDSTGERGSSVHHERVEGDSREAEEPPESRELRR